MRYLSVSHDIIFYNLHKHNGIVHVHVCMLYACVFCIISISTHPNAIYNVDIHQCLSSYSSKGVISEVGSSTMVLSSCDSFGSSCDSFGSGQRDDGSHPSEEEPNLVKCTLVLMSGEVLSTTWPDIADFRLSVGHFFNIAKTSLSVRESENVSECEIRLAIGRRPLTAENVGEKFFALAEVQDMIAEHAEPQVKIDVVRVRAASGAV